MKSEKARKYIEDWTFDATSLVDADGIGAIVLRRYEAFAALIDRISGKGTWERNPWVFVYEFELVKYRNLQIF